MPVVESLSVEEARVSDAYPLLVKAAAGGGGRGMRVVDAPRGLDEAIAAAQREAAAGFGDDRVFIERFLPRARHIEVQVIGDTHGTVRLARRARVLAAAPPPEGARGVAVAGRRRPSCARGWGRRRWRWRSAAGYHGAGTVEFIADADDPSTHFFLEMNTRLQVEHPVTELVTSLDLVARSSVAAGERGGGGDDLLLAAVVRARGARGMWAACVDICNGRSV